MTNQGDSLTRRHAYTSRPATRRRNKLAPDPNVRRAIVAVASKTIREQGVQGLSVAAVLDRAQLSTRAFYRHFESQDQLVAAVFREMTRNEVLRLRTKMAAAATSAAAVAAWIGGRLDLAFDENIESEQRRVSLEVQATMSPPPSWFRPHTTRSWSHSSSSSSVAWNLACFKTSFRRSPQTRSTAWYGRRLSGSGQRIIPNAPTFANARSASACGD
jgi:AcrR family transcriptional regulator